MTPELKSELTAAFEFFGPDMIGRGMQAFTAMTRHACECFVSYMHGGTGSGGDYKRADDCARKIGGEYLRHQEILESAFEYWTSRDSRVILRTLATEWLEAQRVVKSEPMFV